MTTLENSAFKVKACSTPNVNLIDPEVGAIVLSEHDGKMYQADVTGWKPMYKPNAVTAYYYNGSNQYSYVADAGALNFDLAPSHFCLTGWVKAERNDIGTVAQAIFGKDVAGSVDNKYAISFARTNAEVYASARINGGAIQEIIVDIDIDPAWHLFINHFDITNSLVYAWKDTTLINPGGTAFTPPLGSLPVGYRFYIGCGNIVSPLGNPGNYSKGAIRDVRIYHKDITTQIPQLMNGEALGGEVAWWPLGTSGPIDKMGTFHLTNVGSPTIVY
jgi:hypothetical protein